MTPEQIDEILKLASDPNVSRKDVIDALLDLRNELTTKQ